MTVNRNEERVAEGTNGGGPSRPVGKKLTQVASAGRQVLGKTAEPAKKPGKGRKLSQAERAKGVSSGRKHRFFNYPHTGKGALLVGSCNSPRLVRAILHGWKASPEPARTA